jgi:hypothetical protein
MEHFRLARHDFFYAVRKFSGLDNENFSARLTIRFVNEEEKILFMPKRRLLILKEIAKNKACTRSILGSSV